MSGTSDDAPSDDAGLSVDPVGEGDYVVQPGDCISSIAKDQGFFWKTIWDDPRNSALKSARRDPNILIPGDLVTIPDLRLKDESIETGRVHRFRRKGEPAKFRIRLLDGGHPLANQPYMARVDGASVPPGTTDEDGRVEIGIQGNAGVVEIVVGEGAAQRQFVFELGDMAPCGTLRGVQQRLRALGYAIGRISEKLDPATIRALMQFQAENKLEETAEPDAPTRAKLEELYGS
jgi:N-acetylmuramoyl-L-alanine amidase